MQFLLIVFLFCSSFTNFSYAHLSFVLSFFSYTHIYVVSAFLLILVILFLIIKMIMLILGISLSLLISEIKIIWSAHLFPLFLQLCLPVASFRLFWQFCSLCLFHPCCFFKCLSVTGCWLLT